MINFGTTFVGVVTDGLYLYFRYFILQSEYVDNLFHKVVFKPSKVSISVCYSCEGLEGKLYIPFPLIKIYLS